MRGGRSQKIPIWEEETRRLGTKSEDGFGIWDDLGRPLCLVPNSHSFSYQSVLQRWLCPQGTTLALFLITLFTPWLSSIFWAFLQQGVMRVEHTHLFLCRQQTRPESAMGHWLLNTPQRQAAASGQSSPPAGTVGGSEKNRSVCGCTTYVHAAKQNLMIVTGWLTPISSLSYSPMGGQLS